MSVKQATWLSRRREALAYCCQNLPKEAELIERNAARIAQLSGVEQHDTCIILGSGLRDVFDGIGQVIATWEINELEGIPVPKAEGHGTWMSSVRFPKASKELNTDDQGDGLAATGQDWLSVLLISGRSHLYEGYQPEEICRLIRSCALTGINSVFITNAGGCLRDWEMGDLVTITDHLNFSGQSPFTGPVFVDIAQVWEEKIQTILKQHSDRQGTYALLKGPEFQTKAESRYLRDAAGADMVGMSSILEAIAAYQLGVKVGGLSVVCDLSFSATPCEHEQVLAAMKRAHPKVKNALLAAICSQK